MNGYQFLLFNSHGDAKSFEDIIACLDLFKLMGITVFFEEYDSEESLKKLPKLIEHAHACIRQGNYGGYTSREVALKHVAGMEGQFSLYKALLQRGFKVVCVGTQTNSQTRHVQRVVDANMNIAENIVTYLNAHPASKATGLFGSMHCLLVQEPVLTVAQDMECQGYILNEPSNFFSQHVEELPHTCKDIAAALSTDKVSIIDSALLYTSLSLKWHTSEYRESTHSLIQEQVLLDALATSEVVQPQAFSASSTTLAQLEVESQVMEGKSSEVDVQEVAEQITEEFGIPQQLVPFMRFFELMFTLHITEQNLSPAGRIIRQIFSHASPSYFPTMLPEESQQLDEISSCSFAEALARCLPIPANQEISSECVIQALKDKFSANFPQLISFILAKIDESEPDLARTLKMFFDMFSYFVNANPPWMREEEDIRRRVLNTAFSKDIAFYWLSEKQKPHDPKAKEYLKSAEEYYKEKRYDEAIPLFAKAIKGSKEIWLKLGDVQHQLNKKFNLGFQKYCEITFPLSQRTLDQFSVRKYLAEHHNTLEQPKTAEEVSHLEASERLETTIRQILMPKLCDGSRSNVLEILEYMGRSSDFYYHFAQCLEEVVKKRMALENSPFLLLLDFLLKDYIAPQQNGLWIRRGNGNFQYRKTKDELFALYGEDSKIRNFSQLMVASLNDVIEVIPYLNRLREAVKQNSRYFDILEKSRLPDDILKMIKQLHAENYYFFRFLNIGENLTKSLGEYDRELKTLDGMVNSVGVNAGRETLLCLIQIIENWKNLLPLLKQCSEHSQLFFSVKYTIEDYFAKQEVQHLLSESPYFILHKYQNKQNHEHRGEFMYRNIEGEPIDFSLDMLQCVIIERDFVRQKKKYSPKDIIERFKKVKYDIIFSEEINKLLDEHWNTFLPFVQKLDHSRQTKMEKFNPTLGIGFSGPLFTPKISEEKDENIIYLCFSYFARTDINAEVFLLCVKGWFQKQLAMLDKDAKSLVIKVIVECSVQDQNIHAYIAERVVEHIFKQGGQSSCVHPQSLYPNIKVRNKLDLSQMDAKLKGCKTHISKLREKIGTLQDPTITLKGCDRFLMLSAPALECARSLQHPAYVFVVNSDISVLNAMYYVHGEKIEKIEVPSDKLGRLKERLGVNKTDLINEARELSQQQLQDITSISGHDPLKRKQKQKDVDVDGEQFLFDLDLDCLAGLDKTPLKLLYSKKDEIKKLQVLINQKKDGKKINKKDGQEINSLKKEILPLLDLDCLEEISNLLPRLPQLLRSLGREKFQICERLLEKWKRWAIMTEEKLLQQSFRLPSDEYDKLIDVIKQHKKSACVEAMISKCSRGPEIVPIAFQRDPAASSVSDILRLGEEPLVFKGGKHSYYVLSPCEEHCQFFSTAHTFWSELHNRISVANLQRAALIHGREGIKPRDFKSETPSLLPTSALQKASSSAAISAQLHIIKHLYAQGDDINLATSNGDRNYWYSITDVIILLRTIRQQKLDYNMDENSLYPTKTQGEEYEFNRENQQHELLTNPYIVDYANPEFFGQSFLSDIKAITGSLKGAEANRNHVWQRPPQIIVIPFLTGVHWRCIRITIDYTKSTTNILWDDPYGDDRFSLTVKQQVKPALIEAVNVLLLKEGKPALQQEPQEMDKPHNQQGNSNGIDCGPITVANCRDYLAHNIRNDDFVASPDRYTIKIANGVEHEQQISEMRAAHVSSFSQETGIQGLSSILFRQAEKTCSSLCKIADTIGELPIDDIDLILNFVYSRRIETGVTGEISDEELQQAYQQTLLLKSQQSKEKRVKCVEVGQSTSSAVNFSPSSPKIGLSKITRQGLGQGPVAIGDPATSSITQGPYPPSSLVAAAVQHSMFAGRCEETYRQREITPQKQSANRERLINLIPQPCDETTTIRNRNVATALLIKFLKDNNLEFGFGGAFSEGDCFFDSCARALNVLPEEQNVNMKTLRTRCREYIQNLNKQFGQTEKNWVYKIVKSNEDKYYGEGYSYDDYLNKLQYTADERQGAMWGDENIIGKIVCELFGVRIHKIEISDNTTPDIKDKRCFSLSHYVRSTERSGSVILQEDLMELCKEKNVLHVICYHRHFMPLLPYDLLTDQERQINSQAKIQADETLKCIDISQGATIFNVAIPVKPMSKPDTIQDGRSSLIEQARSLFNKLGLELPENIEMLAQIKTPLQRKCKDLADNKALLCEAQQLLSEIKSFEEELEQQMQDQEESTLVDDSMEDGSHESVAFQ